MASKTVTFTFDGDKETFEKVCQSALGDIPKSTFAKRQNSFEFIEKPGMFSGIAGVSAFIRYSDGEVTIEASNGGLGSLQGQHVAEIVDVIRSRIERCLKTAGADPAVDDDDDDRVRCPRCGSTQIQLAKRGWTVATGLLGSGKTERVCLKCMYKF